MNDDAHWMQLALAEAARGLGLTSPNPCVGAAIVRDGQLLATGWHRKAGEPHAEINALRTALEFHGTDAVRGATAYITLEPCSTSGRTPPCTGALIGAGLVRVVWGADDPNPRHAGRAAAMLREAGLAVSTGVLGEACTDLLAPFAKFITTGLPWVIAKAGLSLDGRISRPPHEGQWLTSEASRADAMQLRVRADAILVGAATVRADDPALTLRGPDIPPEKLQPLRVVLTRSGQLPPASRIFTDEFRDRTIVCQDEPLRDVLRDLAAMGVVTVLIEGGSHLHAQAFSAGLVDEAWLYYAPLLCGTGQPLVSPDSFGPASVQLITTDVVRIGSDFRVRLRRLP
jgi:diaminohydroxyphosphoribosylaminopyrimidine deaminase/5-amino-6-(5-phosphoribosylamino)uracil reductase